VSEASPQLQADQLAKRVWRQVAPILVVNLFYFGTLVYPILRIWELIAGNLPGTPVLLLVMVGPLAGRLTYEFWPGTATRWLSAISLTWLGICFLAFLLVISFELFHWIIPLDDLTWGLILLAGLAGCAIYAWINAQRLTTRPVHIDAPECVSGLRLAQISDVHVGSRSGRFLARVVARVNEAAPDYVLITGDLVDFRDISIDELGSLGTLNAPAYFIIGNHERYVDLEEICERLRSLGIHVIRNQTIRVGPMQLIGIDDAEPKSQVSKVLNTLQPDPDGYRVLLYHRPDGADDAARWGVQLMLCGHTHNGQIVPFNFLVRRIFPRIKGLYEIDDLRLYVSPGTGTWGPILRLGSRCEISIITLGDHRQSTPHLDSSP
jgi:predicted MPP superfamily phosphohydrolase